MLFKRRSETAYDPSPPSYAVEWVKAVKGRSARMMPFAKKRTATTARRQRWRRARRKLCARAITMEFGPVSKSNGVWYNSCADKEQGHIQQIHQRRGGRPWRRRCSGLVVLLPPWWSGGRSRHATIINKYYIIWIRQVLNIHLDYVNMYHFKLFCDSVFFGTDCNIGDIKNRKCFFQWFF